MKLIYIIIFIYVFFFNRIFIKAQGISQDFWHSKYIERLHDFGIGWDINTVIKPYKWSNISKIISNDTSIDTSIAWMFFPLTRSDINNNYYTRVGSIYDYKNNMSNDTLNMQAFSVYGYTLLEIHKKINIHLYSRITTDGRLLEHYTGKNRKNRRLGFNSGEFDLAGIQYTDNLFDIYFGRERHNWGAFERDNLALSNNSSSYDNFSIAITKNKFMFKYFHGFLETRDLVFNRYITGKIGQYHNGNNLIIGISEITIYSGENIPMSISYLNPISTNLEIELNNRGHESKGTGGANSVYQFSIDYFAFNKLRFSSNIIIDELVVDDIEKKQNKVNSMGYQSRVSYSNSNKKFAYSAILHSTKIGSYTFRHADGYNNFVARDLPIGTKLGSDIMNYGIGFNIILPSNIILQYSLEKNIQGEENINFNSYAPYNTVNLESYPSGDVTRNTYSKIGIIYNYRQIINLELKIIPDSHLRQFNILLSYDFFRIN